jgi:hypothetical protein
LRRARNEKTIRREWLWPTAIIIWAAGASFFVFGGIESPLRSLVVPSFLFVCPGMAFVRLLKIEEPVAELTLAVALSLALDALVAGTMLYAGMWSPRWGFVLLICASAAGAVLQIARARFFLAARTVGKLAPLAQTSPGQPWGHQDGRTRPRHVNRRRPVARRAVPRSKSVRVSRRRSRIGVQAGRRPELQSRDAGRNNTPLPSRSQRNRATPRSPHQE